nr:MAG TPA: hypothetical protein [Caudoviricetes sp.]
MIKNIDLVDFSNHLYNFVLIVRCCVLFFCIF